MHFPIQNNSKYKAAVQKHNKNPTLTRKGRTAEGLLWKQSLRTSTSSRPKFCCLLSKNTTLLRYQISFQHTYNDFGEPAFLTKGAGVFVNMCFYKFCINRLCSLQNKNHIPAPLLKDWALYFKKLYKSSTSNVTSLQMGTILFKTLQRPQLVINTQFLTPKQSEPGFFMTATWNDTTLKSQHIIFFKAKSSGDEKRSSGPKIWEQKLCAQMKKHCKVHYFPTEELPGDASWNCLL